MPGKFKKDFRIDAYIKNSPPFARPIFNQLRKIIRQSCPAVEETIKWDAPWFMYRGKVLCGLVAFKTHCAFLFNKKSSMVAQSGVKEIAAMGKLRRLATIADLPSVPTLKSYVKLAMKFNEPGAPLVKRPIRREKSPIRIPPDFLLALRAVPKALAVYRSFSPSHKRHYVEWIVDAKTQLTRGTRVEKAVQCLAAGKTRHWH
jgi:uncharacterized protein YdeI (YjbR/CyaY-like superfamily)